jgi:hypothetical protein
VAIVRCVTGVVAGDDHMADLPGGECSDRQRPRVLAWTTEVGAVAGVEVMCDAVAVDAEDGRVAGDITWRALVGDGDVVPRVAERRSMEGRSSCELACCRGSGGSGRARGAVV